MTRLKCIAALAALSVTAACVGIVPQTFAKDEPVAHRVIGQDRGQVSIVEKDGRVSWQMPLGFVSHDIQALPNGNFLLHTGPATVAEVTPDKKTVWEYTSTPVAPNTSRVEVHGFGRLKDGTTYIAESGNRRIIELTPTKVNRTVHEGGKGGERRYVAEGYESKITRIIPLTVEKPDAHRDTRLVRRLDNGNYLACHEGDGAVREYDKAGKVVWEYRLDLSNQPRVGGHDGHGTEVFGAIRLKNGNTLIAGGNNNRVIEVDKSGKTVWSIERDELPGIRLYWVTTLQLLPNNHLIIGNTHAGPNNPQLIEVTHDKEKRVVWTMNNQTTFGNDLAAAQVLDVKGKIIR